MNWVIFDVVDRITQYSRRQERKLGQAIALNHSARVKKLLQQGVNPNALTPDNSPEPLIFATFKKQHFSLPQTSFGQSSQNLYRIVAQKDCLSLLLEYGADPNLRDCQGRTALEIAILWCLPDIVKLLLLYGADPNLPDDRGLTPLMRTAILGVRDARPIQNKLQIALHLIDSGANLDGRSPEGKTALMYATGNSRIAMVELLVSSGASVAICDRQGKRACDIIDSTVTEEQREYLSRILTQPQLNLIPYKYSEFIPEGDRLLREIEKRIRHLK